MTYAEPTKPARPKRRKFATKAEMKDVTQYLAKTFGRDDVASFVTSTSETKASQAFNIWDWNYSVEGPGFIATGYFRRNKHSKQVWGSDFWVDNETAFIEAVVAAGIANKWPFRHAIIADWNARLTPERRAIVEAQATSLASSKAMVAA